jgi:hypothetical protein
MTTAFPRATTSEFTLLSAAPNESSHCRSISIAFTAFVPADKRSPCFGTLLSVVESARNDAQYVP